MLRRQPKKEAPKEAPKVGPKADATDSISRQEAVIWLGRAMSTNEVTLRVVLELLDVVAFQQAQLRSLSASGDAAGDHAGEPALEIEPGTAEKILEKLTQLREMVTPTLKTVEDACRQFEGML